jgi:hypothetical protein
MGAARAAGATNVARAADITRRGANTIAGVTNPINYVTVPAGFVARPAANFARRMTLGPVANTMLDATEDRLGESGAELRQALTVLQTVYVQRVNATKS